MTAQQIESLMKMEAKLRDFLAGAFSGEGMVSIREEGWRKSSDSRGEGLAEFLHVPLHDLGEEILCGLAGCGGAFLFGRGSGVVWDGEGCGVGVLAAGGDVDLDAGLSLELFDNLVGEVLAIGRCGDVDDAAGWGFGGGHGGHDS